MRRLLRALPAAVFLVATVSAQTSPPPPAPLSLDEALAAALASNREIAAARLERPVDVANVDVARERPNPDLTYEGARDTPREAIGLSVPIELGGKRGARTAAAQAAVATGEARLDSVIAGVLDEVRHTYIDLVGAERRVAIAQEVAGLFTRARDAAHTRFLAGEVPRRDDVAAQADALAAQTDVLAAQADLDAARISLNVLLGRAPATALGAAFGSDSPAVPALDAALAEVSQVNTDVRVIDRQIAEQTAQIAVARSLQKPDLTAAGAVTFDAEPDFAVGWRVDFNLGIPIFTTHRAGVVVVQAELTHLEAERAALVENINGAIATAVARAQSAADRAQTYQRDILPLTQQDEAFAQDSYQSGQTGIDALILTLQHARERRLAGLQAILDLQTALADLERALHGPIR